MQLRAGAPTSARAVYSESPANPADLYRRQCSTSRLRRCREKHLINLASISPCGLNVHWHILIRTSSQSFLVDFHLNCCNKVENMNHVSLPRFINEIYADTAENGPQQDCSIIRCVSSTPIGCGQQAAKMRSSPRKRSVPLSWITSTFRGQ